VNSLKYAWNKHCHITSTSLKCYGEWSIEAEGGGDQLSLLG